MNNRYFKDTVKEAFDLVGDEIYANINKEVSNYNFKKNVYLDIFSSPEKFFKKPFLDKMAEDLGFAIGIDRSRMLGELNKYLTILNEEQRSEIGYGLRINLLEVDEGGVHIVVDWS